MQIAFWIQLTFGAPSGVGSGMASDLLLEGEVELRHLAVTHLLMDVGVDWVITGL